MDGQLRVELADLRGYADQVGRGGEANAAAAGRLAGDGVDAYGISADLTVDDDVDRAVDAAVEALGGLDVVVNNAGVCFHNPAWDATDDEWQQVFDLNVRAVWKVSLAAGRHLRAGGGGAIVNIGSISGLIVNRPQAQAPYNASKAAVHQLTKSLAAEWAPHGIRVNAVAPQLIATAANQALFPAELLAHAVQPGAIANVIAFLAGDLAAPVSGAIVPAYGI